MSVEGGMEGVAVWKGGPEVESRFFTRLSLGLEELGSGQAEVLVLARGGACSFGY